MKIRIGFVSNSSSSSFITIISDEDFEDVLKELSSDIKRKIIRHLVKDKMTLGISSKIISNNYDIAGESTLDYGEITGDLREEIEKAEETEKHDCGIFYDAISEYEIIIKNHPKGFYNKEDF